MAYFSDPRYQSFGQAANPGAGIMGGDFMGVGPPTYMGHGPGQIPSGALQQFNTSGPVMTNQGGGNTGYAFAGGQNGSTGQGVNWGQALMDLLAGAGLSAANPVAGGANALSGLLGGPTVQSTLRSAYRRGG